LVKEYRVTGSAQGHPQRIVVAPCVSAAEGQIFSIFAPMPLGNYLQMLTAHFLSCV
jgi:hypothetical protein